MRTERHYGKNEYAQSQSDFKSHTIDTITRIRVVPTSRARAVVMAYIHSTCGNNGIHSLNPVTSIGRVLPDNSEIFTIVKHGDVGRLRHLLVTHSYTLRDRDTSGTPLLHVCTLCSSTIQILSDYTSVRDGPTCHVQVSYREWRGH